MTLKGCSAGVSKNADEKDENRLGMETAKTADHKAAKIVCHCLCYGSHRCLSLLAVVFLSFLSLLDINFVL